MTDPLSTVLLTGANGQVGRELRAVAPAGVQIRGVGRTELDITDAAAVRKVVAKQRPRWIINAAAYTAVDRAEAEPEEAYAVNTRGVRNLAAAAFEFGARLLTVSTDFVFDGRSGSSYSPDAAPNPLNVYGASKRAGEEEAGPRALIVRTGWVHSATSRNFVTSMLRLLSEQPEVRVVADQIGTPTFAKDLATALWNLLAAGATGIHHYTNAGVASWYDFAVAIREEALEVGLLSSAAEVVPIATKDYPTSASRPPCAVLDKAGTFALLGRPAPHWRDGLRRMLKELGNG